MQEKPLNVLVIDDTESHASLVARVVRKNGFSAAIAHSAEDGLALFGDQKFDLVITDIFMDGIDSIRGAGSGETFGNSSRTLFGFIIPGDHPSPENGGWIGRRRRRARFSRGREWPRSFLSKTTR